MKRIIPLFFLLPALFGVSPAFAGCTTPCNGCRMDNIQKRPDWVAFVNFMKSKGAGPISCFRTYACQQQLVRCYGRGIAAAAGTSNHEGDRVAADFGHNSANLAQANLRKFVKGPTGILWHGSCSGGSLHVSGSPRENRPCGGNSYRRKSKKVSQYRERRGSRRHRSRGRRRSYDD